MIAPMFGTGSALAAAMIENIEGTLDSVESTGDVLASMQSRLCGAMLAVWAWRMSSIA
jgi:hypothetical protein